MPREPDILFVANAHLARLEEQRLSGPADLAVEVVSEESLSRDRAEKFYEYQEGGIPEYWVIDPRPGKSRADFWILDASGRYQPVLPGPEGIYRSTVVTGFWFDLNWCFGEKRPDPLFCFAQMIGLPEAMVEQLRQVAGSWSAGVALHGSGYRIRRLTWSKTSPSSTFTPIFRPIAPGLPIWAIPCGATTSKSAERDARHHPGPEPAPTRNTGGVCGIFPRQRARSNIRAIANRRAAGWRSSTSTVFAAIGFVTGGGNEHLAEVCNWHPDRFVGFAHHSPFLPDAVERLERAVTNLGLRGYKLLAPNIEEPIEDPAAFPVWEKCAELGIPVLIHFGIQGGAGGVAWHREYQPAEAAQRCQILSRSRLRDPAFRLRVGTRDAADSAWACPNVSVDTSGSLQWIRWVPGEVTVKYLFRKYYETIGPQRIIFGSDSSWFPRGFAFRYLQDQVRDCLDLNMPDEHIQSIFAGNAARLLKISL